MTRILKQVSTDAPRTKSMYNNKSCEYIVLISLNRVLHIRASAVIWLFLVSMNRSSNSVIKLNTEYKYRKKIRLWGGDDMVSVCHLIINILHKHSIPFSFHSSLCSHHSDNRHAQYSASLLKAFFRQNLICCHYLISGLGGVLSGSRNDLKNICTNQLSVWLVNIKISDLKNRT